MKVTESRLESACLTLCQLLEFLAPVGTVRGTHNVQILYQTPARSGLPCEHLVWMYKSGRIQKLTDVPNQRQCLARLSRVGSQRQSWMSRGPLLSWPSLPRLRFCKDKAGLAYLQRE